ncbi:MAG: FecR domain-containing protein [Polyangia bacterium]
MNTPERDSKGKRALAALMGLARQSVRPVTVTQLDAGLDRVRARLGHSTSRRRALGWSLAAISAVAATGWLLTVGTAGSDRARVPATAAQPALTYRIEGGDLVEGGYLRESGGSGIKLSFAEGTQFVLASGTRSRLRSVDASGARIAIERGTAMFNVVPSVDHRWQVDVGPFLVTVKGTVFGVSWDAATEKLELDLRRGRVVVSGPVKDNEIALRAGQRLLVDLGSGRTVITEQPPASDPAPKVDRIASDHGWARALAAGHLDRIIREAERPSLTANLERASSDDLVALADAARYRRRTDLARDALVAERRRFPDSPHSLETTFLLGRVDESAAGGARRAIGWYDEYLRRAPNGTYASEALGRKMTLMNKMEPASQVRPIAEEYLRRFPGGTYAGLARAFLRAANTKEP